MSADRSHPSLPPPSITFTEGEDDRILRAAADLVERGAARPRLIGSIAHIKRAAREHDLSLDGIEVVDPSAVKPAERPRLPPGLVDERGVATHVSTRLLGLAMLRDGSTDGVVIGVTSVMRDVLSACEMMLSLRAGVRAPSGVSVIDVPQIQGQRPRTLLFADCAVNQNPTAAELAEIAIQTADSCRALLRADPKVAMLSFSTHGSCNHPDVEKVIAATRLVRSLRPDLHVDGEMQVDVALDAHVAERKLETLGPVAGRANVLIFPDLDAGHTAYKLVRILAQASSYGVFLQGYQKPVVKLSRGATVADIVGTSLLMAALIASDAQTQQDQADLLPQTTR